MRIRMLQVLLLVTALAVAVVLARSPAPVTAANADHDHAAGTPGAANAAETHGAWLAALSAGATQDPTLPADAATARDRIDRSPRHGEYAMVPTGNGDSIRSWVVYPERATNAPVVLVVHEIFGLSHWIRGVADQLAAEGFIAIAPDLLTSHGIPTGEDGDPVREQATAAIRTLEPQRYQRQLAAIAEWGMSLPAATRKYGIVGFCWGGTASFTHATTSPSLGASVVYYGSSPSTESLAAVRAPVLGLYAGDDARVNATVPAAQEELRRLGRTYEAHFFEGAGHGFLRQQDGREGANMAATRRAWPMTVAFFRQHLAS